MALADALLAIGGAALPTAGLVALLALVVIALGEFASNTASAAALLPVAGALSAALGIDPLLPRPPTPSCSAGGSCGSATWSASVSAWTCSRGC